MKILPVEAELFHADRRTDMTKLIVAFRNFANAPKKDLWSGGLGRILGAIATTWDCLTGVLRRVDCWTVTGVSKDNNIFTFMVKDKSPTIPS